MKRTNTNAPKVPISSHFWDEKVEALRNNAPPESKEHTRKGLEVYRTHMRSIKVKLDNMNKGLKVLYNDTSRTEDMALLAAYEKAKKLQTDTWKAASKAEAEIRQEIRRIENETKGVWKEAATNSPLAKEQRQIIREMKESERASYVRNLINGGDFELASFVLGVSPSLSGLKNEESEHLRDHYMRKKHPEETKAIEYLNKLAVEVYSGVNAVSHNIDKEFPDSKFEAAYKRHKAAQKYLEYDEV
jgi:hypothetical protein